MRNIYAARLASFVLTGLLSTATYAQATWQGYTYIGSAQPTAYKGMEKLAAVVRERTNGAISIKMNVGGALPIQSEAPLKT